MKRLILIAITCVVVDQLKTQTGWLTKCKGIEIEGEVVFDKKIAKGQAVQYRPNIVDGDEYVHGEIMGVVDAPKEKPIVAESSDTGKAL